MARGKWTPAAREPEEPTFDDRLAEIGSASGEAETDRAVAHAIRDARYLHDWYRLLACVERKPLVSSARLTELANRTLAFGLRDRWASIIVDVARVRCSRLFDERGARSALESGLRVVVDAPFQPIRGEYGHVDRNPDGHSFVWLAHAFVNLLRDWDGHRRCLEAGWRRAREESSGYDLVTLAMNLRDLPPRDARLLLEEAETMGNNPAPARIAVAWRHCGYPDRSRRALRAALAGAARTAEALRVVSLASVDDREIIHRALSRAGDLAQSGEAWLAIAQAAHETKTGDGPIRHALERARDLGDRELLFRVSGGYRAWLGDAEAAQRLGPIGVEPSALRVPVYRELVGWNASASALFDWLRGRATTDALLALAYAGGDYSAIENLAALHEIFATGRVPPSLEIRLEETLVAALSGAQGLFCRALAATLLCLVPGPYSSREPFTVHSAALVDVALELGADAMRGAEQLFAWRAETAERGEVALGVPRQIALLSLFVLRAASAPNDPELEMLAARITGSLRLDPWIANIERVLVPLRSEHRPVDRMLRTFESVPAKTPARVPDGRRPEDFRLRILEPVHGWEPSASLLFDWLRAQATTEILAEIVNLDEEPEEPYAELRSITKSGLIPFGIELRCGWYLAAEVARSPLADALAATLLSITSSGEHCEFPSLAARLVSACPSLGADAHEAAERFFAWRAETTSGNERALGAGRLISLVSIFVLRAAIDPADERLSYLAKEIELAAPGRTEPLDDAWTELLVRVLAPERDSCASVAQVLQALGTAL